MARHSLPGSTGRRGQTSFRAGTVQMLALAVALVIVPPAVAAQEPAEVGLHPDGGGLFIRGDGYHVRLLGYVQPTFVVRDPRPGLGEVSNAFSLRRARVDVLAELGERHTLFLELDGAPGLRTALVEAWVEWEVVDSRVRLRAGKFIGRFSHENGRSSRAIDTVERFLALNSLFLLPGLDTQTGVLVQGERLFGLPLAASAGVYNGNGSAGSNVPEDNNAKELQLRVDWERDPHRTGADYLRVGIAHDRTREEVQDLRLLGPTFRTFGSVEVRGTRTGFGGDVHWRSGGVDLRAEGLHFRFDTDESAAAARIDGGFVQPSWFVRGTAAGGLQLLLRAEQSTLDDRAFGASSSIRALTLGGNLFTAGGHNRLQLNAVLMKTPLRAGPDNPSPGSWTPLLLSQIQVKF